MPPAEKPGLDREACSVPPHGGSEGSVRAVVAADEAQEAGAVRLRSLS